MRTRKISDFLFHGIRFEIHHRESGIPCGIPLECDFTYYVQGRAGTKEEFDQALDRLDPGGLHHPLSQKTLDDLARKLHADPWRFAEELE